MSEDAIAKDTAEEIDAAWRAWRAERDRRAAQLRRDARAVYKAVEGWQRVEGEAGWLRTVGEARAAYQNGRFLVERLGAERYLDPALMATLWGLRQALVAEGGGTAAERMLADLAVVAYHNALRIQQWVGDLALGIEREFFGEEGPAARFERRYGRVEGLAVEERLARLGEQLLPLQERTSRLAIRNLKVLSELRRGPAPSVAIAKAQQVNLARDEDRRDEGAPPVVADAGQRDPEVRPVTRHRRPGRSGLAHGEENKATRYDTM